MMTFASCVLYQNGRRFMAKRSAIYGKTHSVSIQNAPRFDTKRNDSLLYWPHPYPLPWKGRGIPRDSYYRFVSLLLPVREPLTTGSWASYYRFVTDELTGRGPTAVRISTFVFCKTFRHLSYFGSNWLKISSITQKQTIIFGHIRSCFVSQSGTLTHLKRHFSLPKAALQPT